MTGELSWQLRFDGSTYRARGLHSDEYTVTFYPNRQRWHVWRERERRVRRLGVTRTLEKGKALAQRDFARGTPLAESIAGRVHGRQYPPSNKYQAVGYQVDLFPEVVP